MIAQCKGYDLVNVPESRLLKDGWNPSIKYDGNYVQIEKRGNLVKFWTSGGKEFCLDHIADYLVEANKGIDFTIETEYIADTEGKLGSRGKCTTTTFRVNFQKGIKNKLDPNKAHFKVFDCIYYEQELGKSMTNYSTKYKVRKDFIKLLNLGKYITLVDGALKPKSLIDIQENYLPHFVNAGWEGLFLINDEHIYKPGKRVNTAIKLKGRPTADLLCIGVKYSTINPLDIGSLIVRDSEGRECAAGGLVHSLKRQEPSYFIGKIIEISYEQILDTYMQPMFKCIREDKTKEQ